MSRKMIPVGSVLPRLIGELDGDLDRALARVLTSNWLPTGGPGECIPRLNISESEAGYQVTVELPGMEPDDVTVEFKDDSLWISGEFKNEDESQNSTMHRVERQSGSFRRVVRMGNDVSGDGISASFKNGLLTVTAARCPQTRPQRIEVKA